MLRTANDFVRGTLFHRFAEIHHDDAVRNLMHQRKIMRDDQQGDVEAILQIAKQVNDLGLDRNV